MMKQLFSLILMAAAFLRPVVAQPHYFRHYQVEQGLSNNTVFCMAQDKGGFIWMGTKEGLNRFDGYGFKVFRNDPDDSLSIGDDFIRSMFIDTTDSLYAGTRNGVYKYLPATEQFRHVYKSGTEVKDMCKDRSGNLWMVAGRSLIRFHEQTVQTKLYSGKTVESPTAVCIDTQGIVWVGTAQGLLLQYLPEKDTFLSYNLFPGKTYAYPKWIEKIYAGSGPFIMVGTSNYGVKQFHSIQRTHKDVLTYNAEGNEIFARDFLQTAQDEYWVATESGLFLLNTVSGKTTQLRKQYGNPFSLPDNAVYTLLKDKEGGIWAGTYFGGAAYYAKPYALFEKFFPLPEAGAIHGNAVREICEDRFGNIWIGTEDAGLNRFDPRKGTFTSYHLTGSDVGISYPNIHGLLARKNELWVGTFEHGLDIMDIYSGKVIRHFPEGKEGEQLKSSFIVVIHETRSGEIFIGTRQGLYRFLESGQQFEAVKQVAENAFIHSITEDKHGVLWIGTLGNGLFRYDPVNNETINYLHHAKQKKSLPGNSVTTGFQASDGTLWFGTEGGGLCRFNEKDQSFTTITTKEGLPGNTIFRILEDERRNLWITTSNGLVRFQPGTGAIQVYTTFNGLLSNQFNYNSGYRDASGQIYLGTAKGLIRFRPASFTNNQYFPPVHITGLYINNKEPSSNLVALPLQKANVHTSEVVLSYDESSFSIDFAAPAFTAPEMTGYKYILEGLDKDWTYLKSNRKVYFTNLRPGRYVFKVQAANSEGLWGKDTATLQILIQPPWWESNWAFTAYFLIAALIVYLLFRNYQQRMHEKTERKIELMEHEKEKELYQTKINFFTDVAHEIRTPLTLIRAPMEKIMKKAGESIEWGQQLKIMQRNTDRLLELTGQLLDFRRVETNAFRLDFVETNIGALLKDMCTVFRPLAEQKKISFNLHVPPHPVMALADTDSLQKMISNLLSNAFNYGKKKVEVVLRVTETRFSITVSNDGPVIPLEMKEKIFEPFYRIHHHSHRPGSGIGLALSRSLAGLHHGTLELDTSIAELNVFTLSIPLQPEQINETAQQENDETRTTDY
ncbi:two-component regulator propeller domain-containing protein [Parasegetibacter sp. NRK P23]|uniref:ligand-binding sensor domain-containing protein n=1 Tax=Parasegetibacter sp. NRK P23 TaxID=2942999 RepID=UPI0020437C26|nr:sensor histidine kinase [Parasegetibacter sp. NRK P23]MCM5528248.1 ATP-binding protein [Parasegetibacter sp. NRK P23]